MSRTSGRAEIEAARKRLHDALGDRYAAPDRRLIDRAAAAAESGHQGQRRGTGEPYVCHPYAVAATLAGWKLDGTTIAAALLHDLPEDTEMSVDALRKEFGDEVADLVEAVTKLGSVRLPKSEVAFEVENLRRLFLAMAKDLRVVLLKLADRLHNAWTMEGLPESKRARYGREILEIYAPLADRLGMGQVRSELAEIGFRYADPKAYLWTRRQVRENLKRSERYLDGVKRQFRKALAAEGIAADINARTKNTYSLYRKLKEKERDVGLVYDLLAIRIIVESVEQCYQAMGIIHQHWQPLPHRIKDYIAVPKLNGYRSLHTTVFGPGEKLLEVQFRTWRMHEEAERGVAAHAIYADRKRSVRAESEDVAVIGQLRSWQDEIRESSEFIQRFKLDLFADRIFVFTPKGGLHSLPAGSTPVDFAYAVHTEVGNTCRGAKVNGVIVPLDSQLSNGDVVEVLTSKTTTPKRDWLGFVRTGHARNSIRRFLREDSRDETMAVGRDLFEVALRREGLTPSKLDKVAVDRAVAGYPGAATLDDVLVRIGDGRVSVAAVLKRLGITRPAPRPVRRTSRPATPGRPVVAGAPNVPTRRAACCQPRAGDPIIGYVTRGKGITVHRRGCRHLQGSADPARIVPATWS